MPALLPWDETKESATTTSSKYWHYSHHHSFQFSVLLKPWIRRVVRSGGKKTYVPSIVLHRPVGSDGWCRNFSPCASLAHFAVHAHTQTHTRKMCARLMNVANHHQFAVFHRIGWNASLYIYILCRRGRYRTRVHFQLRTKSDCPGVPEASGSVVVGGVIAKTN